MDWGILIAGILPGLLVYAAACVYARQLRRIERGEPSVVLRWRLWRARKILDYMASRTEEDALRIGVAMNRLEGGVRRRLTPLVAAGYVHAIPTPVQRHSRFRLTTAGLRYAYRRRQNPAEMSLAEIGAWRSAIDRAEEPEPRDPIADYVPGQWRDPYLVPLPDPPPEIAKRIESGGITCKRCISVDGEPYAFYEEARPPRPAGTRTATTYSIDGTPYTQIIG